jgi:NADPH2:quinone reductase
LNIVLLKGCQVIGFTIGAFLAHEPAAAERNRRELFEMFAARRIRPRVSSLHRLDDAAGALREVAERRAVGKVILEP